MLRIVDTQAGGDITRVIIDGAPIPRGDGVAEQCEDFARRFDPIRLKLIQPPHGELHMCVVLLLQTDPSVADFGVIIMESMGYPPISGSNLFCATAVALERGMAAMAEPETRLRVATAAGVVPVTAWCRRGRCHRVAFENTPARIKATSTARLRGMAAAVPFTVIAAGVDYAVLDAEALGLPLTPDGEQALIDAGTQLTGPAGTDFVLFHGSMRRQPNGLHCRLAVFQNPGLICRSPTGTGTSAMLAMAHSRGLLKAQVPLTATSPRGGSFTGRILSVHEGPGEPTIDTVIEGDVETGTEVSIP